MLAYNLDLESRSTWLRSTPGELERAQPFFCSEQGEFFAHGSFFTDRSEKDSYELFYTLEGCGSIEQGGGRAALKRGMALLIDCRSPQRYHTASGEERWYHLWAHIDGAGVRELARPLGIGALHPVPLAESIARRHFSAIAANL